MGSITIIATVRVTHAKEYTFITEKYLHKILPTGNAKYARKVNAVIRPTMEELAPKKSAYIVRTLPVTVEKAKELVAVKKA
jgi:hypothetical protein